VFPAALKEFLSKSDYNTASVLHDWDRMGIIMRAKNGKSTQKTSMQSYIVNPSNKDKTVKTDYPYMYRLDIKLIEQELMLCGDEEEQNCEAEQKESTLLSRGQPK
jgi:hypothetical protein